MVLLVKNLPANAGDMGDVGFIPGSGRSPGRGHGNPLQYFCLENPMDRGAWQAMVHRVAQSLTQLKWLSTHARTEPEIRGYTFISTLYTWNIHKNQRDLMLSHKLVSINSKNWDHIQHILWLLCNCCSVAKSCPTLLWHHGLYPARFLCPWDFPSKNIGVVAISFSKGSSPVRGWDPCLLLGWQILYLWVTKEAPVKLR